MISRTTIKSRLKRKTNPDVAETIQHSLKNKSWTKYSHLFARPARQQPAVNLSTIDRNSTTGDTILIPGKVLSQGNLSKKIKICALSISKLAREKLKPTKSEFSLIIDEIKKNQKAEGLKVIK